MELAGKEHQLEQERKDAIEFGNGFYLLEDGSKSTDANKVHLRTKPAPAKPKGRTTQDLEETKHAISPEKDF